MEFIIGIIGGICIMQFCVMTFIARELKKEKEALNAELKESIEKIALSHNNLVASIAEVDKKAQDAKLRLNTIQSSTKPSVTKFG